MYAMQHVSIAIASLRMGVETLRHDQVQMVLGPRHGDVQKPALFLDLRGRAGREIGGDASVNDVQDKHRLPLLSLRRVNRREDQVVLVEQPAHRPHHW